jgi:hypothetical protein
MPHLARLERCSGPCAVEEAAGRVAVLAQQPHSPCEEHHAVAHLQGTSAFHACSPAPCGSGNLLLKCRS